MDAPPDLILEGFLAEQHREARELEAQSDLISLQPVSHADYLVRFRCRGLVKHGPGRIEPAERFLVGIRFPPEYLREAHPATSLTLLDPLNAFHPNIRGPLLCVGRLSPGTPLVDIIFQIFDLLTFHKWSTHDGLNDEACEWARNHQHLFPTDRRPLKRRVSTAGPEA